MLINIQKDELRLWIHKPEGCPCAESAEVNQTGYFLKYYKDRADGATGFVKSKTPEHIIEAVHEIIEPVVGDFNKMHESNSDDFLRKETTEPKK